VLLLSGKCGVGCAPDEETLRGWLFSEFGVCDFRLEYRRPKKTGRFKGRLFFVDVSCHERFGGRVFEVGDVVVSVRHVKAVERVKEEKLLVDRVGGAFLNVVNGSVKLSRCGLVDDDVVRVIDLCKKHGVVDLNLCKNDISDVGGRLLIGWARCGLVLNVRVDDTRMSVGVRSELQGVLSVNVLCRGDDMDGLRSLSGRGLGDVGCGIVADYLSGDGVCRPRLVGVAKNGIGAAGAEALGRALLSKSPCVLSIETFEAYSNVGTNVWAFAFSPVIRYGSLVSLDLGSNGIDDEGAASLAGALGSQGCTLCELHLDYNKISDVGGRLLGSDKITSCSRLHTVWLHGNLIGDGLLADIYARFGENRRRLIEYPSAGDIGDGLLCRSRRLGGGGGGVVRSDDDVALMCLSTYLLYCENHVKYVTGQTVVSGIVEELGDGRCRVVSFGVGTRFVDSLLLKGDRERVKDSHAEVLARRSFCRYLYAQVALVRGGGSSTIFTPGLELRPGVKFHLYTSTAPCGVASTSSLDPQKVYKKGGGETCTEWVAGWRKSCTDKIRGWFSRGLQCKRLGSVTGRIPLERVVIGRKYSQERCSQAFPAGRFGETSVRLEALLKNRLGERGDSDTSITWSVGESRPHLFDGKTGLFIDTRPVPISPWWMDQEWAHVM